MDFKLGKLDHKDDPRTLALGNFLAPVPFPKQFDFDHDRKPFPTNVWGNDAWGDCVMAGRANQLLRLERIETRQTLPLQDIQVTYEYQQECQREFGHSPQHPGDQNDNGLVVLYAIRNWRSVGWNLSFLGRKTRNYRIAAFGELNIKDLDQIRRAIWLLHGAQIGLSLPVTAQKQTAGKLWDDTGSNSPDAEPGSWGGHLVFSKRYKSNGNICVLTWGMEIEMTPAFIARYADEAWGVVDDLDKWRSSASIDVKALEQKLHEIGASRIVQD